MFIFEIIAQSKIRKSKKLIVFVWTTSENTISTYTLANNCCCTDASQLMMRLRPIKSIVS